ncbi:arginyl-tRNA-protein transferase 1 [Ascosphaera apis ARSEF 7405]|uniref:arginyltransferase n=1 Tax=Ascosphaera apis ARSEF 7405 TaxID=392613 RepID=A0A167Z7Q1_9EURO|nr:arginyl-tRNA-protein transferase 1 [Ascosphaera apis ARSEF 7405]
MSGLGGMSFMSPRGYQRNGCGYCKRDDGSISYYAHSESCRAEEYEVLMNHGWRRSGKLFYRQNPKHSCCPYYTIRLDPKEYVPRKDQKKALNKWNNFVLGPEYKRKAARLAPKTKEQKRQRRSKFNVFDRIHDAEYSNIPRPIDPSTSPKRPIEPAHKFEVNLESDSFSLNKYNLFLRYQKAVHHEDESQWPQSSFKRFLCSGLRPFPMHNPFKQKTKQELEEEQKLKKLGSYHQCYRLDGKLIAVAVLDLLPSGLSSVYLYYDPDYEAYEFGKISAMREIALTQEAGYGHYYMGYYIHNCVKMRYKANFRPQQVLDPEDFTWHYLDTQLLAKLDKKRYVSLSREKKIETGEIELEECDKPDSERDFKQLGVEREEERSLFEIGFPGILTKRQVQKEVDLDHWQLAAESVLVDMCDLRPWDTSDLGNPQSIKGIVGEMAAMLGKEVVKKTVVILF